MAEIIIITYGQPQLEEQCVESVKKCTNLEKHTLTIVNNHVRDKNLGALWNELIGAGKEEFICLLNSDTIVEPDWLDKLVKCAEKCEADAVGPTTDHCGYRYQMVSRGNFVKEVDQLSGFCLLLRRASWQRAGGFREDAPFYGQESNLLRRLRQKVLCGSVFVHHEAGASVRASQRQEEERALSLYWWPRNTKFNWKNRVAVLGSPESPFPLWRGISQAMVEFQREGMAAQHFDQRKVTTEELQKFNPTVVITVSQRWDVIVRCAGVLQSFSVPKACWFNDLRGGGRAGALSGFDWTFLCFRDSPQYPWSEWERLSRSKIGYMPQGSIISTEIKPMRPEWNLIFIGGTMGGEFHSDRQYATSQLRAHVINEIDREKRIEIEKKSRTLYRHSRFVLSMSPIVPGYSSIRLYNIMAYGGLALVARFPGMEKMFTHEKHLLSWKNVSDAQSLMNKWIAREKECETIRRRGWRLQQAKHTVTARLMNMVANMTTSDHTFWGEAS